MEIQMIEIKLIILILRLQKFQKKLNQKSLVAMILSGLQ